MDQVKVKQEPGVEEECGFSGGNVKSERGKDDRRSACMVCNLFSVMVSVVETFHLCSAAHWKASVL